MGRRRADPRWLAAFMALTGGLLTFLAIDALSEILAPAFERTALKNLPFLIREHERKNQYSIAQATLWRKR